MVTNVTNVSAEPVCVVISDGAISEDEVRRCLGDFLPLSIVQWQDRRYLATIRSLRPQVLVVLAPEDEVAQDSARLVACLFASFMPTIISAATMGLLSDSPRFMVHQLGVGTAVRILSPSELRLP